MTIRKRPKFSDTPSGRLKSIYQEVFVGPAKEIDDSLSERLYSIVRLKQALAGQYNWLLLLLMMPLFIIYDFLRVWGFAIVAAGFRYLPPKLRNISSELSFDPSFYNKYPAKHIIIPNRLYSGPQEIGVSDGEHLWVENAHSANRPIAGFFIIGLSIPLLIPVIFEPLDFILGLLMHPLSPLVTLPLLFASLFSFSFLPVKTGIMFHRRAQTATFYRGWFRKPVTVPYKQVTYTAGIDPRGTGGWLVIRARVPENISFTGWVKLSTAISDQKAMAAGAIDVFMDLDNDFAMPRRIKESIEWHQENKTNLWRYTQEEITPEEADNYSKKDSLYNSSFCDTFMPQYKKAMNPKTINEARQTHREWDKRAQRHKASELRTSEFNKHKKIISSYIHEILNKEKNNSHLKEFKKIEKNFHDEISTELRAQFLPFYLAVQEEVLKLRENEESQSRRADLRKLSDGTKLDLSRLESLPKLDDFFHAIGIAYREKLIKEETIRELLSKLKSTESYSNGLLKDYDWSSLEQRALEIVFS
ncbi:hypothetical protein [Salinibius halmophilus]|uniref:hypothetical protein n=1 Tax=Salinibius halmophilus TaxID=1853216 RepID=UPI000E6604C2|nr:hypothetical protein [Salinibius halmophilus]